MVSQSTAESTATQILASAEVAAVLPGNAASTGAFALGLTGSYSDSTTILPPSDLMLEVRLDTHSSPWPMDLPSGDEVAFRAFSLAYRTILWSMYRRAYGDTDLRSPDDPIQPTRSSGWLRRGDYANELIENSSPASTSTTQPLGSETADVLAGYYASDFNSDSPVAEIERWLRDLRTDARTDLSVQALYRIEVESWLESMRTKGEAGLADRLALLRSMSDEDDEDDAPLSDEAMLGFMDFLADVRFEGNRMSLTSANGWLCTEWAYDDGRSLVLWFKNRTGTMITAFGNDGELIAQLGRDPSAANRREAADLLVSEGFFGRRAQCST